MGPTVPDASGDHAGSDRRRPDRRVTRAVLLVGVTGGLLVPAYFLVMAETVPLAWDFRAYVHAADLAATGRPFVGVSPPVGGGEWVYPPLVVVAFYPFRLLADPLRAFAVQTLLQTAFGLLAGTLVLRLIEETRGALPTLDRMLVVTFPVASTYGAVVLGQGQTDPTLLAALAAAFLAVERGRETVAGVLFALPAVVKLFPAMLGVWLVRLRAWRAVVAAAVTGTLAAGASVALFGVAAHRKYLAFLLGERSRLEEFAGTMSPDFSGLSLSRPLSALFPEASPLVYVLVAALLLAPVIGLLYVHVETTTDRLVAFLGTGVAVLLVSPASNVHHVFLLFVPIVGLLYLLERGWARRRRRPSQRSARRRWSASR
jgi:hypothetical protein